MNKREITAGLLCIFFFGFSLAIVSHSFLALSFWVGNFFMATSLIGLVMNNA